jgi:hypothetical protein
MSGIVPLYPPPPNIIVSWFHPTGRPRRSLMFGADGSTGKSAAWTLQYSMVLPLTTWVTWAADSTRPPLVGNVIADAGMGIPASSAHLGTAFPAAAVDAGPRIADATTSAVTTISRAGICLDLS